MITREMKRVVLWRLALLAGAVALPAASRTARGDQPPNVILIMADDLGQECLSCYGSASYETPHLDRLASQGMRFTHCYSQPLCTPTRVKIMTGRFNFRNYVEFGYLDPAETTFAHMFQRAGYRTCIAGKWQLNGLTYQMPRYDDATRPAAAGFHEHCLWQLTHPKREGERYARPLIEKNAALLPRSDDMYGPQVFADFVCDFIERNRDRPFLVYYPMVLTHDPFVPTPDSPAWQSARQQKDDKFFADMVRYVDKLVGQIDETLERVGVRDRTLLLFTGDNGTSRRIQSQMSDGRTIQGGKGKTTDAGTRVPLVASWPGVVRAGTNENLIDFTDFFATFAELLGDAQAGVNSDGVSFLAQLRGEPATTRQFLFCHYEPRWGAAPTEITRFARDAHYKLYADGRFYHVASDPVEQQQHSPSGAEPLAVRTRLQEVLDRMPQTEPRPPRQRAPRRPRS